MDHLRTSSFTSAWTAAWCPHTRMYTSVTCIQLRSSCEISELVHFCQREDQLHRYWQQLCNRERLREAQIQLQCAKLWRLQYDSPPDGDTDSSADQLQILDAPWHEVMGQLQGEQFTGLVSNLQSGEVLLNQAWTVLDQTVQRLQRDKRVAAECRELLRTAWRRTEVQSKERMCMTGKD